MYNPFTGFATVPVTGTYIISFSIEDFLAGEVQAKLKIDGEIKASAAIAPTGGSEQSGATVILGLTKGQSVWVEAVLGDHLLGEDIHYNNDNRFIGTIFTAALLY